MGIAQLLTQDKSRKVLMIDDDEDILLILQTAFVKHGWKVFTASDGKRALSMMVTDKFDAIVTDLHMPKMDGLEFIFKAKANMLNRASKFFVISGAVDSDSMERIINIGVANVVVKPFNPENVVLRIEEKCKKGDK